MTDTRAKGTYTLLIELAGGSDEARKTAIAIEVGALGTREFPAGWYAYTGSALGSGGFSRVDRHRAVAAGEKEVCHWHIDYLLGHPATRIDAVGTAAGTDAECAVAGALPGERVPGFGASDCRCDSHLTYVPERAPLADAIERVHADRR